MNSTHRRALVAVPVTRSRLAGLVQESDAQAVQVFADSFSIGHLISAGANHLAAGFFIASDSALRLAAATPRFFLGALAVVLAGAA